MQLTEEQKEASVAIINFLVNQEQKELILSSPAGCGKTFLVSWFLKEGYKCYKSACIEQGKPYLYTDTPVVVATTNKAAEVLSNNLMMPVSTIHKYLGLVVCNNLHSGTTTLEKSKEYRRISRKIIFIDECSMIDQQLYSYIQNTVSDSKIIYVGDKNQLPPVNSGLSPIYTRFPAIPLIELNKNVRQQKHVELLDLATQLRNTVETGIFKPIKTFKGTIEHISGEDFKEKIDKHFLTPTTDSKILAYTNKRTLEYNTYIKYNLRKYEDIFVVGEHYILNSVLFTAKTPRDKSVLYSTDTEIIIKNIRGISTYKDTSAPFDTITLDVQSTYDLTPNMIRVPLNPLDLIKALKTEASLKEWGRYFNLKEFIADVRLADCSTIHKAQGSTYKNVFLDLSDLNYCRNPNTVARLLYVACSRATDHIYLYGSLQNKYGGIIE